MDALFAIPDPIRVGIVRDLTISYGSASMDDCWLHMQRIYNTAQRDAQDDAMLFKHLAVSLTESFAKEIKKQLALYTINISRGNYCSGILFLKLILSKAQTDTVAMVSLLRKKVSGLSEKMSEMQGNIVEFNTYVNNLFTEFAACGANCDELIPNGFWAYLAVEDETFVRLAELLQDEWLGAPGTPLNSFMTRTENEYNIRIQMGTWKAPTKQASEILALKALLQQAKVTSPTKAQQTSDNNKGNRKANVVTPYKSYAKRTEEEQTTKPWKFICPKEGETWDQQRGNVMFHWCYKHKKWVTHTDAECTRLYTPDGKTSEKKNNTKNVVLKTERENEVDDGKEEDEMKVNRALMSFVNDSKDLY
jgi:hypothetical protein